MKKIEHKILLITLVFISLLHPNMIQAQVVEPLEEWRLEARVITFTGMLEEAYWNYMYDFDFSALERFADMWRKDYPPTEQEHSRQSDTLAAIYEFYHQICAPELPTLNSRRKVGRSVQHHLFQEVRYDVVEHLDSANRGRFYPQRPACSLSPFCPEFDEAHPLFVAPEYRMALDRFLGDREECLPEERKKIEERTLEESLSRARFLAHLFDLMGGHWGGWVYDGDPTLYSVIFDKEFLWAYAAIGVPSWGEYNFYHKVDGRWTLVKKSGMWVQ